MDKNQINWLEKIASDVEAKYDSEICSRIFGDLSKINDDHDSIKIWFERFISGMDRLNDKSFLMSVMVTHYQ